jgi:hypothetical protein
VDAWALELGDGETCLAALETDYLVAGDGELLRKDAAHHSHADDNYINFFESL